MNWGGSLLKSRFVGFRIIHFLLLILLFSCLYLSSCQSGDDDSSSSGAPSLLPSDQTGDYTEIDVPSEIAARAFSFAELYESSDTVYGWGGQDPVRSIKIDCSGLVIMCYKYALVDTKYQLLLPDMSANYMYEKASTHIEKSALRKGDLLFMVNLDEDGKVPENPTVSHIALFEKIEDGKIHFIDSTKKDSDDDGIIDIDGVTRRCYSEDDLRFYAFGRMRVRY